MTMSDIRVLFDGNTYISGPAECPPHLSDMAYFINAPEDVKLQRGYLPPVYAEVPDGVTILKSHWTRVGNKAIEIVDEQRTAAEAQAQAAQAEQVRILTLAGQYGGLVAVLAGAISALGYAIPCDAPAVLSDVLRRMHEEMFTAGQEARANTAFAMYKELKAVMSDSDIAAIAALGGGQ